MAPLDLVKLSSLMDRTSGKPEVSIGLIDGPVAMNHPELSSNYIREIPGNGGATCNQTKNTSCQHGTFVAGILSAKRNSSAPAICPKCTLLVRPIFSEKSLSMENMPSANVDELVQAILDCMEAGARVINLSAALAHPSTKSDGRFEEVLDHAAKQGVIVVAAAGNQGALGSTPITRHPWVIPVVAYNLQGNLMSQSNLGSSIGRRGLGAPAEGITSFGINGKPVSMSGTSVAAPFVTGSLALLCSEFPKATAVEIKIAVTRGNASKRTSVVPPLLDAWNAYQILERRTL